MVTVPYESQIPELRDAVARACRILAMTFACYQRLIQNQTDLDGTLVDFDGIASVDVAASNCPTNEFTIETFMDSGGSWGSYHFFGGPAA